MDMSLSMIRLKASVSYCGDLYSAENNAVKTAEVGVAYACDGTDQPVCSPCRTQCT